MIFKLENIGSSLLAMKQGWWQAHSKNNVPFTSGISVPWFIQTQQSHGLIALMQWRLDHDHDQASQGMWLLNIRELIAGYAWPSSPRRLLLMHPPPRNLGFPATSKPHLKTHHSSCEVCATQSPVRLHRSEHEGRRRWDEERRQLQRRRWASTSPGMASVEGDESNRQKPGYPPLTLYLTGIHVPYPSRNRQRIFYPSPTRSIRCGYDKAVRVYPTARLI